jgi:hypothetical protein
MNRFVEFKNYPDLNLSVNLYPFGSDTPDGASPYTASQRTNAKGIYRIIIAEDDVIGDYDINILEGSILRGQGCIRLGDQNDGIYRVQDFFGFLNGDIDGKILGKTDSLIEDIGVIAEPDSRITTILNRIGGFLSSSIYDYLIAMMRKDVTVPLDIGGTYNPLIHSLESYRSSVVGTIQVGLIPIGIGQFQPYYGTLDRANTFFSERLKTDLWFDAIDSDKEKSLRMSAEVIDRLSFKGCKTLETQSLEFPRSNSLTIPIDIEKACYFCAYSFLDGYEPDQQDGRLGTTSEGFSLVRATFDRTRVQMHLEHGIPSIDAWRLLKPYLNQVQGTYLRKV